MSFRLIKGSDIRAYQQLLHRAYQATSQLGIHFAAATVEPEEIAQHIDSNAVYLLEKEQQLISTLSTDESPNDFGKNH